MSLSLPFAIHECKCTRINEGSDQEGTITVSKWLKENNYHNSDNLSLKKKKRFYCTRFGPEIYCGTLILNEMNS